MKSILILLSLPLALTAIGCDKGAMNDTQVEPDNTQINDRDADGTTLTPFDQSNDQADLDLAAKIREQVVGAKDMSIKGQNVKIITNGGKVVLRGPVASAAEKQEIEKIAVDAAGTGKVTNDLEVDSE